MPTKVYTEIRSSGCGGCHLRHTEAGWAYATSTGMHHHNRGAWKAMGKILNEVLAANADYAAGRNRVFCSLCKTRGFACNARDDLAVAAFDFDPWREPGSLTPGSHCGSRRRRALGRA